MKDLLMYRNEPNGQVANCSGEDSIRSRIEWNKNMASQQLEICNKALAALDANPELASALELVHKAQ